MTQHGKKNKKTIEAGAGQSGTSQGEATESNAADDTLMVDQGETGAGQPSFVIH